MYRASLLCGLLCLVSMSGWALQLEYLHDQNISTGTKFQNTEFGGISALAWRVTGEGRELWALSDDRGRVAEPRLYRMALSTTLEPKPQFELKPEQVLFLKLKDGESFRRGSIDPEGLVFLGSDKFIVSSEGDNNLKPRVPPQLLLFSDKGKMLGELPVPPYFVPEKSGLAKTGIRNNAGFEGLGLFPDGKHLLVGTELPLTQDDSGIILTQGGLVRLLKYELKDEKSKPIAEWVYPLEPARGFGENSQGVINGFTEVLPLSENKALVLERGLTVEKAGFRYSARLYETDLTSGKNILGQESIDFKTAKPLAKKLVLDFEDIREKLSAPKTLDNLEGMAWGPKLKDGRRTLILISDNNFASRQRTQIIYLAVAE